MDRREFLNRLEELLQDISQRERVEALAYYNDYFDDAGQENEQKVIEELVSPEKVAETIKEGLGMKSGCEQPKADSVGRPGEYYESRPQRTTDWSKIILIVLLCIVLSPVLVPLGGAALGIVIGIPCAFFGVLLAVGITGVALLIAGIAIGVAAIVKLFTSAAVGVMLLGVSFLIAGLGLLATVAAVWICVKLIPWFIQAIVGLFRKPFNRKGGQVA